MEVRPKSRGFTLVEVLLVVALVGVLMGVALPKYKDYRNRVKLTTAIQDITVLSALIQAYRMDTQAYPGSLADIGNAFKTDPWGNPYQYYNVESNGRGHARKDHAMNPINSDFDLYSMGPDGQTKPQISQKDSVDDIIRAADGSYIGIASGF